MTNESLIIGMIIGLTISNWCNWIMLGQMKELQIDSQVKLLSLGRVLERMEKKETVAMDPLSTGDSYSFVDVIKSTGERIKPETPEVLKNREEWSKKNADMMWEQFRKDYEGKELTLVPLGPRYAD